MAEDLLTSQNTNWVGVTQRQLPPTFSQVAEANRAQEKLRENDKVVQTAVENEWMLYGGQRALERNTTEFAKQEGYEVPDQTKDELSKEYGFDIAQEITKDVVSQEDLNYRMANAKADKERNQILARNGFAGFSAQLAAAAFDPVGWAASLVAAPVAGAIKVGRVGRILKTAVVAGAENAALEAVVNQGDYQRSADDVLVAAGFGMIMGGTIGGLTRERIRGAGSETVDAPTRTVDDLETVVSGADEFDVNASRAVRDAMEYDAYMAARDYEPARAPEVDQMQAIADHIDDLRSKANIRMSGKEKGRIKEVIRQTEAELEGYKASQVEARAQHAATKGAARTAGEALDTSVELKAISRRFDGPIQDAQARLDDLRSQLSAADNAGKMKDEHKRFSQLPRDMQIKELGLDQPARRVEVRSAVKEALAAIRKERVKTPTEVHAETMAAQEAASGKPKDDSVGAARVKDSEIASEQFDLSERMDDLMDDLAREANASTVRPMRTFGLGSVSSVLMNSKNPINRGLALRLLENAQGGAYHGKTASILSNVNNNLIKTAERNRYNDGFSQFIKENNLRATDYLNPAVSRDFDNQVYSAIVKGIPEDTPAGVKLAAEGLSDKLKVALEIRKRAGEAGFDDVQAARDYMPVIMNGIKITEATNKIGKEGVIALLSKGYQTGKFKMSKKSADAVAKVQYLRASDATLSSRVSFDRVVSQEQQVMLIEDLKKAGVPDSIIDNFIETTDLAEMADSVSNRAKQSLGINTQATYGGLRVQDLLNTNVGELVENYGKEAAGGAAMASMGFPTRQAVYNAIDAAERAGRNMAGNSSKEIQTLRQEADMLRDSVRLIYGNTIDADPNSGIVRGTRRVREVTGLLRLGQMGFAQLPELARSISKMGVGTVLKSVPATKFLRSRAGREGGTAQGRLLEPELREMEELVGYIGEDNWLTGWNVRHDEFGESADNMRRMSQIVDNGLAIGSRINTVLSGFKAIQGGSEKIVARSINKRLKDHLSGVREIPARDLAEIGLDENTMARLKRHFDDNPKYEEYNGQQVRMINFEDMEPDLREMVGVGVRRLSGRLIQRNFVGDEGIWMNKWWGKALTQFKSFSIVSIEKQLIHDLRGDKIQAAQILAWSTLLGYASYATQMQMQALGREDRDKFLDEKFSNNNIAMGVFNKLPQVAGFGLAGDALATFGLMPDEMMQAPGRLGFRQQGFGDLVAGAGVIGDFTDFGRAMVRYANGDDDLSTRQLVDKGRRLVPLANTIGVGQMTKASVDLLEDK